MAEEGRREKDLSLVEEFETVRAITSDGRSVQVPKSKFGGNLEVASANVLGGIKADEKSDSYTQEVKIDPLTGKLFVPQGEGTPPDDEDITVAEIEGTGKLQFKDKKYNASSFSGLGRTYLRKNLVSAKNVLTQAMFANEDGSAKGNTRYVIQYDYDLKGATIEVPEGCILDFQGGSLSNGVITGDSYYINDRNSWGFLKNVHLLGANNEMYKISWYVSNNKGEEDCSNCVKTLLSDGSGKVIYINAGVYRLSRGYSLGRGTRIVGESSGNGSNERNYTHKSIFYIHDVEGDFLECSASYISIDGVSFDGFNGVVDNFSPTLGKFVVNTTLSGFLTIKNCHFRGTSKNSICIDLGQAMWSTIENCFISHIINGIAISAAGATTTVSITKCYFTYCRQILQISSASGYTLFTSCVFESSYTLGNILGNVRFFTCHFENLGYSLSSYAGISYIYDTDIPLDCVVQIIRGWVVFDTCVFYKAISNKHNYMYRCYSNTIDGTFDRNGGLSLEHCRVDLSKHSLGFEIESSKLFYIGGANRINEYFLISADVDYFGLGEEKICQAVRSAKGSGRFIVRRPGNTDTIITIDQGVTTFNYREAAIECSPYSNSFAKGDVILSGSNRYKITFAESHAVNNAKYIAGEEIFIGDTTNIKIGDKCCSASQYYPNGAMVTDVNSSNNTVKLSRDVNISSGSIDFFTYVVDGNNYGVVTTLPTLNEHQASCFAQMGLYLYYWDGTLWTPINPSVNLQGVGVAAIDENNNFILTISPLSYLSNKNRYSPIGVSVKRNGKVLVVAMSKMYTQWCSSSNKSIIVDIEKTDYSASMSDYSGRENTAKILATAIGQEDNNAARLCNSYSKKNVSGTKEVGAGLWWLPSMGEMQILREARNEINYIMNVIGGSQLEPDAYWTSSVYNEKYAWMSDSPYVQNQKTELHYCVPVTTISASQTATEVKD